MSVYFILLLSSFPWNFSSLNLMSSYHLSIYLSIYIVYFPFFVGNYPFPVEKKNLGSRPRTELLCVYVQSTDGLESAPSEAGSSSPSFSTTPCFQILFDVNWKSGVRRKKNEGRIQQEGKNTRPWSKFHGFECVWVWADGDGFHKYSLSRSHAGFFSSLR